MDLEVLDPGLERAIGIPTSLVPVGNPDVKDVLHRLRRRRQSLVLEPFVKTLLSLSANMGRRKATMSCEMSLHLGQPRQPGGGPLRKLAGGGG